MAEIGVQVLNWKGDRSALMASAHVKDVPLTEELEWL